MSDYGPKFCFSETVSAWNQVSSFQLPSAALG